MSRNSARPWISIAEAQDILGASRMAVFRLIDQGNISTLAIPGSPRRVSRADCLRLAGQFTNPATVAPPAPAQLQEVG